MQRYYFHHFSSSKYTANVIDSEGRLLVFGEDAPANVMLHYGFWLCGVLFVDYEDFIENSGTQATHFGSFIVSCLSGEFWHARLLTASHLFVLDAILYFRNGITVSGAPLAIMPRRVVETYRKWLPLINLMTLAFCVFCMLTTVVCGPTRLLCFETDLAGPIAVSIELIFVLTTTDT